MGQSVVYQAVCNLDRSGLSQPRTVPGPVAWRLDRDLRLCSRRCRDRLGTRAPIDWTNYEVSAVEHLVRCASRRAFDELTPAIGQTPNCWPNITGAVPAGYPWDGCWQDSQIDQLSPRSRRAASSQTRSSDVKPSAVRPWLCESRAPSHCRTQHFPTKYLNMHSGAGGVGLKADRNVPGQIRFEAPGQKIVLGDEH